MNDEKAIVNEIVVDGHTFIRVEPTDADIKGKSVWDMTDQELKDSKEAFDGCPGCVARELISLCDKLPECPCDGKVWKEKLDV